MEERGSKRKTDIREKLLGLDADHERGGKKLRMRSAQTDTKEARKSGTKHMGDCEAGGWERGGERERENFSRIVPV